MRVFVAGIPKGQPRPRAFVSKSGHAGVVDPGTAAEWKYIIRQAIKDQRARYGPLEVWLDFRMPRPKAHYRTGKYAEQLKESAPVWHIKKPDPDNLAKAVLDACNGILWQDDAEIAELHISKIYADDPAKEGVVISWKVLQEARE